MNNAWKLRFATKCYRMKLLDEWKNDKCFCPDEIIRKEKKGGRWSMDCFKFFDHYYCEVVLFLFEITFHNRYELHIIL